MAQLRRGPGLLADPSMPREQWGGRKAQQYVKLTLSTYGTVCWLCGLPGANSADHVIPRSKGGAVFHLDNLGPAHKHCNESRGNRPAETFALIEDGTQFFSSA
ncbi:HNH endonuclease [Microterricola gilva]|uniref:HNH endonuclease n=2 Tax=Microterricola gilva TaxID=393267 RepID=A0A4Q8AJQ2_9MICO|nr:HNH endonuclease [Microterricola gilva]